MSSTRGSTAFFASAVPGIGPILAAELAAAGVAVTSKSLFDGRNDVVAFNSKGTTDLAGIATAEDAFVEAAVAHRQPDAERLARALAGRARLDRAQSVASSQGLRLPANATFRVIARVRSERDFRRTELRDALITVVATARPRWRLGDPAQAELWALETEPDRFRLGLRLTGADRRQHGGRVEERPGALRPTVAAALVRLAGEPSGMLLDPCCGSGTVLREASSTGWRATGADIDPAAAGAARVNAPAVAVLVGDVRALPFGDGACAAVASNLPFGRQFQVDAPRRWYAAALGEMARVVAPGGAVVVLAPRLHPPRVLQLKASFPVRVLGQRTTLWHLHRGT